MKEKFRDWNFKGTLNVKYSDSRGNKNYWNVDQDYLLNKIKRIVEAYEEQDIILTNRQLYYQLVASDVIPNADEVYKRVCKFLTDARYSGLIDWDSIEDRGRIQSMPSEWANVSKLIDSACYSYRLPRWKDQDYYVELYCEKQAMESVLKPISQKYHIFFGYNKGYSSASSMYDLAKRLERKIEEGKDTVVLYLGDHDPSGLDMVRDIRDRITEFLNYNVDDSNFRVKHLALTENQIKEFSPPPNPAKITDPRAKNYIREFGNVSWELDALKPEYLKDIAEEGVLEFLDLDKYNEVIELEEKQKKALVNFGKKLKS